MMEGVREERGPGCMGRCRTMSGAVDWLSGLIREGLCGSLIRMKMIFRVERRTTGERMNDMGPGGVVGTADWAFEGSHVQSVAAD